MTAADWVVLAIGVAAIGWVNWYFFLSSKATGATSHGHEH